MKPWYAHNARDLLETRRQGMQPEGPVHVAMDGGAFEGTALYLRPDMPLERMDWRMLVNLDVCLRASPNVPLNRVIETASRIAHARPRALRLHFDDGAELHEVDVGFAIHRERVMEFPAIHEFFWYPVDLSWTSVGHEIQKSLKNKHRPLSTL